MKLIIEMPDGLYKEIHNIHNGSIASACVLQAAKNGTPLPKGHGDLIDWNKRFVELNKNDVPYNVASYIIEKADVVIEADKKSENKE